MTRRIVIWIIAFLLFYLFTYLIDPFAYKEYIDEPWSTIIEDFLWVLLISVLISEFSMYIDNFLHKRLSWDIRNVKRLLVQSLLQIVGSVLIVIIFYSIFYTYGPNDISYTSKQEFTFLGQWIAVNIAVSFIISAINTGRYLLESWKKTAIEAAQHKLKSSEHKRIAMAAELQALKLQIDPHFIFNNLSVLSEIILEDQQLGYEYSESFAKVYRYLLVNSKKDNISLEEELKFLDSYIYLITKRIGEGVRFDIAINNSFKNMLIPPLTLQFLVENALKHNQTSKINPLIIKIYTTKDQYLVVHNTLVPLVNKANSSGIGIKNIISRFEFMGQKKPLILKTDTDFIAKIPLYEV